MRTFLRQILPIGIIIGAVGIVAYWQQAAPPAPTPLRVANGTGPKGPPLVYAERVSVWDMDDPMYGMEYEQGARGHYDFWVANQDDSPTSIELTTISCQCAAAKIAFPKMDAIAKAAQTMPGLSLAKGVLGAPGFEPAGLCLLNSLPRQDNEWHSLEKNKLQQIPAADKTVGQRFAIIRLEWEAKNLGPTIMAARFSYFGAAERRAANLDLEARVSVVKPCQVFPVQVNIGDVRSGESRPLHFLLWTSTRNELPLKLPEVPSSCFVFGEPKKLTPTECLHVGQQITRDHPSQPPTKPRAAWSVPLTIHESHAGSQLELGPLTNRLVFNAGTEMEASIFLTGRVRGEIRLVDKQEEDQIKLGDFRSDQPLTKVLYLTCGDPNTKLEIDSVTPPTMQVTLKQEAKNSGTWRLQLMIPENTLSGQLTGQGIMVRTVGPNPRKIRIPLSGTAFVQ